MVRKRARYTVAEGKAEVLHSTDHLYGVGYFEDISTISVGHLIMTRRNNTGGFAQAPTIARALYRAIVGEHDPIYVLFNPHRSKLVTQMEYSKASL